MHHPCTETRIQGGSFICVCSVSIAMCRFSRTIRKSQLFHILCDHPCPSNGLKYVHTVLDPLSSKAGPNSPPGVCGLHVVTSSYWTVRQASRLLASTPHASAVPSTSIAPARPRWPRVNTSVLTKRPTWWRTEPSANDRDEADMNGRWPAECEERWPQVPLGTTRVLCSLSALTCF